MILKGFEELQVFLEKPKNIVVVGHRNPDGDAMGSTLALSKYLEKKGHKATVVVPNEYPAFLHWPPIVLIGKTVNPKEKLRIQRLFFYSILMHCTG